MDGPPPGPPNLTELATWADRADEKVQRHRAAAELPDSRSRAGERQGIRGRLGGLLRRLRGR